MNHYLILLLGCLLLAGCASSTIESRKKERAAAYAALPQQERELADKGQIQTDMSQDAVYIAWGPPAQILQNQSGNNGVQTVWLYEGTTMQETRYWTFREVPYRGHIFLERYLDRDYDPRAYVSAEIVFVGGKVASWRTLPRPTY
ncbi:MAG: hypothetical protein DME18_01935 [Verrucomicrobia bacterium]|nr:MAG: hypothetical protein DME18_01935 [Verrucomicrobiota bacterium]